MNKTKPQMDRLMPPLFFLSIRGSWTALGFVLLNNHAALAQRGRAPNLKASVSLEVNTEVVKRLATVEDHVKERQWSQAILILEQVAADHGNTMMPLAPGGI